MPAMIFSVNLTEEAIHAKFGKRNLTVLSDVTQNSHWSTWSTLYHPADIFLINTLVLNYPIFLLDQGLESYLDIFSSSKDDVSGCYSREFWKKFLFSRVFRCPRLPSLASHTPRFLIYIFFKKYIKTSSLWLCVFYACSNRRYWPA